MYRILVASALFDDLDDLLTAMETARQLSLDTGAQIAVYRLSLARAGYRSSVVLSVTGEEAPISVTAWVHQRVRWLKGFIQTTLVHGLLPRSADRWSPPMRLRDRLALAVQLPVQLLCIASHPVGVAVAVNDPQGPLAVLLVSGNLLTIITFAVAARRIGRPMRDALALPLYSFLHTAALAIAVVELITAPSYWRKTEHGFVASQQRVAEAA